MQNKTKVILIALVFAVTSGFFVLTPNERTYRVFAFGHEGADCTASLSGPRRIYAGGIFNVTADGHGGEGAKSVTIVSLDEKIVKIGRQGKLPNEHPVYTTLRGEKVGTAQVEVTYNVSGDRVSGCSVTERFDITVVPNFQEDLEAYSLPPAGFRSVNNLSSGPEAGATDGRPFCGVGDGGTKLYFCDSIIQVVQTRLAFGSYKNDSGTSCNPLSLERRGAMGPISDFDEEGGSNQVLEVICAAALGSNFGATHSISAPSFGDKFCNKDSIIVGGRGNSFICAKVLISESPFGTIQVNSKSSAPGNPAVSGSWKFTNGPANPCDSDNDGIAELASCSGESQTYGDQPTGTYEAGAPFPSESAPAGYAFHYMEACGVRAGTVSCSLSGGGTLTFDVFWAPLAEMTVSPLSLDFTAREGGSNPSPQTLTLENTGTDGSQLIWGASPSASWLSLRCTTCPDPSLPTDITNSGSSETVEVSADVSGLVQGTYSGTITFEGVSQNGSPVEDVLVAVNLVVDESGAVLSSSFSQSSKTMSVSRSISGGETLSETFYTRNIGIADSSLNWECQVDPFFTVPSGFTVDLNGCHGGPINGGVPDFGSGTASDQGSGLIEIAVDAGGGSASIPINIIGKVPSTGSTLNFETLTLVAAANIICSFDADPKELVPPNPTTLSWSCQHADACGISACTKNRNGNESCDNKWPSVSSTTGSQPDHPTSSTRYVLNCTGAGNATEEVPVDVSVVAPTRGEIPP